MPVHDFVPPLPSERGGSTIGTRHMWLISVWHDYECGETEARADFQQLFGRPPDRVHCDSHDGLTVWWMGWITAAEAAQIESERKAIHGRDQLQNPGAAQ